jgi:hypothetical protein
MAYPADPLNSNAGDQGVSNEPTREYLEQLASAIRPSWELDDTTFGGLTGPSSADVAGLNGTKEASETRSEISASKGSFAPSRATVVEGTERAIAEAGVSRLSTVPIVDPPPRASAAASASSAGASPRFGSPRLQLLSVPPAGSASFEVEASAFARSRKPLWIVLSVGVLALIAIGGWAASGGDTGALSPVPTRVPVPGAGRSAVAPGPSAAPVGTTAQGLHPDTQADPGATARVARPSAPASNSPPRAIPEPISPPPRAIPEPISPPPRAIPEPISPPPRAMPEPISPPPRAVPEPISPPPRVMPEPIGAPVPAPSSRASSAHEAPSTEPPRPSSRPLPSGPLVRDVPF